MPTVPQLKAELKQLGVKGYSKKLKGELIYMLVAFKKANAKEEVKKPEPVKIAIKDIREKRDKERKKVKEAEQEEQDAKNAASLAQWRRDNAKMRSDNDKNAKEVIEELEKVVAETNEASKEGGAYKRRDNWKGKAKYYKMIRDLYRQFRQFKGSPDVFYMYLNPFQLEVDWRDWVVKQQNAKK
jgi:hypothetical protein